MSTDRNEALRLADAIETAVKQTDADDQVVFVARWFAEPVAALLRQQAEQIDQLRAEVERLRADAERYQWLRDCHPADKSLWVAMGLPHAPGGVSCWRNDELDAAIEQLRGK